MHDRNYISDVRRIRIHNLLIVSPAYYHLAITTDNLVIIRVNTLTISYYQPVHYDISLYHVLTLFSFINIHLASNQQIRD